MHFTYAQSFDNVPVAIQKYILNNAKDDLDSLRRVQILDLFAKMKTAYDERYSCDNEFIRRQSFVIHE